MQNFQINEKYDMIILDIYGEGFLMKEKLIEEYNKLVEKRNEYQQKAFILNRSSFETNFVVSSVLSFIAFILTVTNLPKIVVLNIIPLNIMPSFCILFPMVVGTSICLFVDKMQKIKKKKKSFSKAKSQNEILKEQLQYEIDKEKIDNYRSVIKRIFEEKIESVPYNVNDKENLKKEIETLETSLENAKKILAIATTRKKLNDYFWRLRGNLFDKVINTLLVGAIGAVVPMFIFLIYLQALQSINITFNTLPIFIPAIIGGVLSTGYSIKRYSDRMKVFKALNKTLGEDALETTIKKEVCEDDKNLSSVIENEMYQMYSLMKLLEIEKQQLEDIELQKKMQIEKNLKMTYETKEKEIINLYARHNGISEEKAELIYSQSQLKNIIRDKESTLYLESAYYILERYSEYMVPNEPQSKNILEENYQRPIVSVQMGNEGEFEERSNEVLSRKLLGEEETITRKRSLFPNKK